MTTLREAAQQALEALGKWSSGRDMDAVELNDLIATLEAALEQQEQEPVAWQWLNSAYFRRKPPVNAESGAWNPLYTAPPRREWQSLTEEEAAACWSVSAVETWRAIEAKLKEKNA